MEEFSHGPQNYLRPTLLTSNVLPALHAPRTTLGQESTFSRHQQASITIYEIVEDISPTNQYDRTMKFIAGLLFILASSSPGFAEPHPIKDEVKGSVGLVILSRAVRT